MNWYNFYFSRWIIPLLVSGIFACIAGIAAVWLIGVLVWVWVPFFVYAFGLSIFMRIVRKKAGLN